MEFCYCIFSASQRYHFQHTYLYGRLKWTKRAFININKSFININKSFINIYKSFINTNKSFIDINKSLISINALFVHHDLQYIYTINQFFLMASWWLPVAHKQYATKRITLNTHIYILNPAIAKNSNGNCCFDLRHFWE